VTGLVYVAIVALWAAVLIPMWLRRHDDDQARRIERHRLAMGTLARFSDAEDVAQVHAGRRRRLILAGAATVGALGSAAWVAGIVPGLVAIALWLPFVAFLPAAVLAERAATRRAAARALARQEEARAADSPRAADVARAPVEPAPGQPSVVRPQAREIARPAPVWDDVFDQTA
jgi:membrane protein implicated in regulation of membrane protease activity